jgi:hypothetical protein
VYDGDGGIYNNNSEIFAGDSDIYDGNDEIFDGGGASALSSLRRRCIPNLPCSKNVEVAGAAGSTGSDGSVSLTGSLSLSRACVPSISLRSGDRVSTMMVLVEVLPLPPPPPPPRWPPLRSWQPPCPPLWRGGVRTQKWHDPRYVRSQTI